MSAVDMVLNMQHMCAGVCGENLSFFIGKSKTLNRTVIKVLYEWHRRWSPFSL